jgi:hypothetical protein
MPAALPARKPAQSTPDAAWSISVLLALAVSAGVVGMRLRARRAAARPRLDAAQRARLVADVRQWIQAPAVVAERDE